MKSYSMGGKVHHWVNLHATWQKYPLHLQCMGLGGRAAAIDGDFSRVAEYGDFNKLWR